MKYDDQFTTLNDPRKPSSDIYYGGVIASQGYPNLYYGYNEAVLKIYALQETEVYVTFALHSPILLLENIQVLLDPEGVRNSRPTVFSVNQSTPVSVLLRARRSVRISLWRDEESLMLPAYLLRFSGNCQK